MKILYAWEHNGDDSLVYAENYIGAYVRGSSLQEALEKMEKEIAVYAKWRGIKNPSSIEPELATEKLSGLNICDADTEILFDSERAPLIAEEYDALKKLALKSAADFLYLYHAIPDKHKTTIPPRHTFYGEFPRTAFEMYEHTKNVNDYYFGEIGVNADNSGNIAECRRRGFELLEQQADFLKNKVVVGNYDEEWSLRKVLRRFVWHDRIHAKAMYRMAKTIFSESEIPDCFYFIE